MRDNLKTWPEKIYLINDDTETPWCDEPLSDNGSDVEYIRTDVAKEREAKLIEGAFQMLTGRLGSEKDYLEPYHIAGLEELK
jgi:hypothetical protein